MMDLTVEIEGDIGTLEEALRRFTSTETLDGENKYQCSRLVVFCSISLLRASVGFCYIVSVESLFFQLKILFAIIFLLAIY